MIKKMLYVTVVVAIASLLVSLAGCSSSGSGSKRYYGGGVGYHRYYGPRPWGYYPGYIVDGGGAIDPGMPEAVPLPSGPPDMGMPDFGGMDFGGMDMGGFDF